MRECARELQVRPYQLMCSVCLRGAIDEPELASDPRYVKASTLLAAMEEEPDTPITLRCQVGFIYSYQDPGTEEDTPEGADYNRKRDLDILQALDLWPGATLPARTLYKRLLSRIPAAIGICGYRDTTSPSWRGCAKTMSGNYERGRDKGIDAFIPPRSNKEMLRQKERSVRDLQAASELTVRPHHLMCSVCQFGRRMLKGEQLPLAPVQADNVVEFLHRVLNEPKIPVVLVRGADAVICAPCPWWVPRLKACTNVTGSGGLSCEKRDTDVLQRLGLTTGTRVAAGELYRLLFSRIPTVADICVRDNPAGADRQGSVWDSCDGVKSYEVGRLLLMGKFLRD